MNQVIEFFSKLFDYSDWPPRWHYGKWSNFHGWLYIVSDLLIWSAYFAIPVVIVRYVTRKSDAKFVRLYFLFAAFILACGATHFLDAVSFWFPLYRLNALVRLVTGIISWITVFQIIRLVPLAFSLPSQKTLQQEIERRKIIESELRDREEQVETIFKNAPDAIVVINSKGIIKEWNPAAEAMFGWQASEVLGNYLNKFIVPEGFWDIHAKAMNNYSASGDGIIVNKPIVQPALCKSGEKIEVEFIVSPVKIKNEYLLIGFIRDVTEKLKAVEALRESEERYRLLTTEVKDYAILMLSPEGNISSWNEGVQRIKGYARDEIIGKHFSIFYTSNDIGNRFPMEELRIAKIEGRFESEGVRVKKDGSLFWANVVITALKKDGKIIGFSKILRDITRRKKSQEEIHLLNSSLKQRVIERTEELQASENKYRSLFESNPMPLWVLEMPSLKFIDVNESAISHYGYSRQEFLSMDAYQIWPDNEKERFKNFDRLSSRGTLKTGVWKHLKKDGSIIYVEINSHEITINNKRARLVLSNDITDRKKAEERLDIALAAGQIGIWELDIEKNSSVRNLRLDQVFGYDEPQPNWGIKEFMKHIYPEDLPKVRDSFQQAMSTRSWAIETRIIRKDQSLRWISVTGKINGEMVKNTPLKILGTVIDITNYKKAEQEILELNADLEKRVIKRTHEFDSANKELEAFSYSVSHDLRAPLRAILGYAQILTVEYKETMNDEAKRLLNRVMFNAKKMSQLIDDLLEFLRLSKSSLQKSEVNLNKIVEDLVTDLGHTSKYHHNVSIGELGTAVADDTTVRILFQNLLSNAIKYSSKKEHPRVEVGVTETARGTTYFIKDNGAGFDMTYYDKLFGIFQRLHRQEEFEGTGVGLAIVQKIVAKHGGQIWAESEVGQGATFFFTLNY